MPKFVGSVGYGFQKETSPGVYTDVIEEKQYYGDIMWNNRRFTTGPSVNDDLTMNQAFSVLADEYANSNATNIRYVKWNGMYWKVTSVELEPPRMKLYAGGVYNGPTPTGTA